MSKTLVSEEHKAPPKWQTIVALVFSLFTILPAAPLILSPFLEYKLMVFESVEIIIFVLFYYGGFLFGATAFILGIMGLKYRENTLAITALVISIIGFILNTYIHNQFGLEIPFG